MTRRRFSGISFEEAYDPIPGWPDLSSIAVADIETLEHWQNALKADTLTESKRFDMIVRRINEIRLNKN